MRSIFRYEVPVDDQIHAVVLSGDIVHVDCREHAVVEFWAVHGEQVPEERRFRVYGTGHRLPDTPIQHRGTALDGPYVWHLIEEGAPR